jgi:PPP family 3-phenylpropionic acid transporter
VAAEIVMLLVVGRLAATIGPRALLALSVAAAVVRWTAYAFSVAPAVLVAGQLLHACTYAGFHVAAVQTVYRLCPAGTRATGQAFYSGWTFGAGMMVGTVTAGVLKDHLGAAGMFGSAAAMALAALGLIILGAGRLRDDGTDRRGPGPGPARGPGPDPR